MYFSSQWCRFGSRTEIIHLTSTYSHSFEDDFLTLNSMISTTWLPRIYIQAQGALVLSMFQLYNNVSTRPCLNYTTKFYKWLYKWLSQLVSFSGLATFFYERTLVMYITEMLFLVYFNSCIFLNRL